MIVSLDSSAMSSSFTSCDCVNWAADASAGGSGNREIKKETGVEADTCLRRDITAYVSEKMVRIWWSTCLMRARRQTHIDLLTKFFFSFILINLCFTFLGRIVGKIGPVTLRVFRCFLRWQDTIRAQQLYKRLKSVLITSKIGLDILELPVSNIWQMTWLTSAFSNASFLSDILPGLRFSSQEPMAHPMLMKRSCPLLVSDTDSFSENTPRDVSMRWMRYRLSSAMDKMDWASGDERERVSSKMGMRGMREWE